MIVIWLKVYIVFLGLMTVTLCQGAQMCQKHKLQIVHFKKFLSNLVGFFSDMPASTLIFCHSDTLVLPFHDGILLTKTNFGHRDKYYLLQTLCSQYHLLCLAVWTEVTESGPYVSETQLLVWRSLLLLLSHTHP